MPFIAFASAKAFIARRFALAMSPRIEGHALPAGSPPPPGFKPLGTTGLWCHPLGFGCYRVEEDEPSHEAALRAYLERGGI